MWITNKIENNWFLYYTTIIFIGILFLVPILESRDCYSGYVQECEYCHSKNMSYGLCSGVCFECDNKSSGCEYDLDKNCTNSIPHNYCAIEQHRWRFSILKLWGEE